MALRLPYFFMNLYCALSGGHREVKFFIYEYISSTSQILVAVKFIDFEYKNWRALNKSSFDFTLFYNKLIIIKFTYLVL